MENAGNPSEHPRDLLANAIIASLRSWPEMERRIFVEVRYCGKSSEEVARLLGLQPAEVSRVLEHCELRLHRALKTLRDTAFSESSGISSSPHVYTVGCCFH